jgi:hypothetical protein
MAFELWETSTGNLIGSYAAEQEALELIRGAIEAHGDAYVHSIALGYAGTDGRSRILAQGKGLVERALAAKLA